MSNHNQRGCITKFISTIFILVVLISLTFTSLAQTDWTKYPGNPVLDVDPSGEWDDTHVAWPVVVFKDSLHMWYTGFPSNSWEGGRVGYATSKDDMNWKKYEQNPINLNPGGSGSWDEFLALVGPVICQGDTFKMWYTGCKDNSLRWRTGYAISMDGINWNKHPDTVIDFGQTGDFDSEMAAAGTVILDGGIYKMWYLGRSVGRRRIGYAFSSDGISWTKDTLNNPVFSEGDPGEWDANGLYIPLVIKHDDTYHMWYGNYSGTAMGHALSSDGISWAKDTLNNPVLKKGDPGKWDSACLFPSSVLLHDSKFKMYYDGYNEITQRIGLATAGITSIKPLFGNNPSTFELHQNYPNPFNLSTTIEFDLPKTSEVSLKVFNILGEEVATLVSDRLSAGSYSYNWNASNMASGVYLYRLQAGENVETRKMILMR